MPSAVQPVELRTVLCRWDQVSIWDHTMKFRSAEVLVLQASRAERERILRLFIEKNQCKTGPELEHEFKNGASLFLTRLCAHMKTSVASRSSVGLTFQAISIFISSASGTRFLNEFIDVGGSNVIVEILRDEHANEVWKVSHSKSLNI
jgi:hypothetical protein